MRRTTRPLATPGWERHVTVVARLARGERDVLRGMRPSADDDSFVRYAAQQHVARYVLARATSGGGPSPLPSSWLDSLGAEVARNADRESRIPAAMAEVVDAFAGAGLACRVLKGPPFAQRYYGDPSLRRSVDIDLLVREEDAHRAIRVLLGLGYAARARRLVRTPDGPAIRRHRLRTDHGLALTRDGFPLDLHWRLRTAPAYRIREDDLWANAQRVRVHDVTSDVLSDEYALVLLLLSIAHDIGRCGCRLKHLLDVYQLLRARSATLDWPRFLEKRREENVLKISVNVLAIVLEVFACRDGMPHLVRALGPHAPLLVDEDSLRLVHGSGDGIGNAIWFTKVYPVSWARDAAWWLDRSVPHPGRVFVSLYRAMRFGVRSIRHVARGRPTPRMAERD